MKENGWFVGRYDAAQVRSDLWTRVEDAARRLNRRHRRGGEPGDSLARVEEALELLTITETFWAFPGSRAVEELRQTFQEQDYELLEEQAESYVRVLAGEAYRRRDVGSILGQEVSREFRDRREPPRDDNRPYFEVLVVDRMTRLEETQLRQKLLEFRREEDEFIYDLVFVDSLEDALVAILFNHNLQVCLLRDGFEHHSELNLSALECYLDVAGELPDEELEDLQRCVALGEKIHRLRPELSLFMITDSPMENVAGQVGTTFSRVYYHLEDWMELHLSILKGVMERFRTPFFQALRQYSHRPTGVFHALPISRGKSISKSHWIRDMGEFYGPNIFLAETSATTGGLDSLLQPHGPLKEAQKRAARAFQARNTYFVTNGTSTANKIVVQALVRPGDIVLVSRDCHKSHHYALLLAGAQPVYMDPYPLSEYSMFGAVPLAEIKTHLETLQKAGKLERVRMVLLTNCTFDGVTYNPLRVMKEVLAIKPDMVFLWDEAWFAYSTCSPTLRQRTAMTAARRLTEQLACPTYRRRFQETGEGPNPDRARVRVYVTQSTHKTLTALRQGSMIHIRDQDFEQDVSEAFSEAYMTHTSTSPNYQILASLDVGRRQIELEGYEMVQKSIDLAMVLRRSIAADPLLKKFFRVLGPADLIGEQYRPSGIETYYTSKRGWEALERAYQEDEFALDPTRVTVAIGQTGVDGNSFKTLLMEEYDIQINKTSRNTVLFMIQIAMSRGTVVYLVDVLMRIARQLEEKLSTQRAIDQQIQASRVATLTQQLPPLPTFSRFHHAFAGANGDTPEGQLREAFFLAYNSDNYEYLPLDGSLSRALDEGRTLVSASFVTPYPPGFPVLVPGQEVSRGILDYLKALDVKEIHGYRPEYGLRIFKQEALDTAAAKTLAGSAQ